ncbi:MAG: hypothetical protein ABI647_26900, partial [Gemmatimonadota bacterium]
MVEYLEQRLELRLDGLLLPAIPARNDEDGDVVGIHGRERPSRLDRNPTHRLNRSPERLATSTRYLPCRRSSATAWAGS